MGTPFSFTELTFSLNKLSDILFFDLLSLQQATGAVLVSQEPSKVILYRGWGAREENGRSDRMNRSDARKTSAGREGGPRPTVSPELRAAIRLECGLKSNQDKGADPN